ncbi:NmrA family protein [Xylanimonas cellulosilytica DSM 15894]|uniref:NmrA family protein n=1 Tax=Xylanimonas cellulosilytica (strain DSM 15894 / JCM 12276 / CECT 5975 / KCTC 9989 / LMG 20990 / NBRC 107835 / XIL07) TaxID=446471 RepID=D1BTD2_XYLCX|nr:NAD(P)H-binding protein [Xylanimonas cellulosilytica]ACZ29074.1 NmrA family protein [Xylanimonas cellulosilytica DSM 15894]
MPRQGDDVVAVTGASGRLGTRLALRLAAEGAHQRLIVRDLARVPRLPDGTVLPDADVAVVGSYGDGAAMRRALDGVRVLFLVSARETPDRVAQHLTAVDAAVAAGVERVVYTSFLGAAADAVFTFARDHFATEQHLRRSGLRWTFLRDNLYHHALTTFVGDDGVIRGPAGRGRVASVSHDDVADVATAVLLDERTHAHDARTYELTGPTAITLAEAAATLAELTGRSIRYETETVEQAYASRAHYGAGRAEVEGWVTSYTAIAAGELEHVSDDVARLVGRPARSFADWLDDYPDQWAHLRR